MYASARLGRQGRAEGVHQSRRHRAGLSASLNFFNHSEDHASAQLQPVSARFKKKTKTHPRKQSVATRKTRGFIGYMAVTWDMSRNDCSCKKNTMKVFGVQQQPRKKSSNSRRFRVTFCGGGLLISPMVSPIVSPTVSPTVSPVVSPIVSPKNSRAVLVAKSHPTPGHTIHKIYYCSMKYFPWVSPKKLRGFHAKLSSSSVFALAFLFLKGWKRRAHYSWDLIISHKKKRGFQPPWATQKSSETRSLFTSDFSLKTG